MAQVQVDTQALVAAAREIRAKLDVAREMSGRGRALVDQCDACGNTPLAQAVATFVDGWGAEMGRLAYSGDHLATLLENLAGIYDRIEAQIQAGP